MDYQTVFSIPPDAGWWLPILLGDVLGMLFWGALFFWSSPHENRTMKVFYGWLALSLILFGVDFGMQYRLRAAALNTSYEIAEGTVESFQPYVTYVHPECFSVGQSTFCYRKAWSHFFHTPAFGQTANEGGPMRPNQQVRIFHVNGSIGRIDIRRDQVPSEWAPR